MKWLFLLMAALLLSACNLNSRAVEQQSLNTLVAQVAITPTVATEEARDEAPTPFPTTQAAAAGESQTVSTSGGQTESIGSSGGVTGGGGGWRPVCKRLYDWPI